MSTKRKGDLGEDLAAAWLSRQSYHIIKRNLRSPSGEVDIVVYRDGKIVFVEVKAWSSNSAQSLGQSIHSGKRRNIISTARFFLRQYPEWSQFSPRFDILFVGPQGLVDHFPGAFTENGFV
jgi:putative endonuclease